MIVADPTTRPVTRPPAETVATALLLVVQLTARPLSGLPFASLGVAVSCTEPPTYAFGAVGLTRTEATGRFATVIVADALRPSLVAVIVADPTAAPLTRPPADTVAIAELELVQVTSRPARTLPAASLGVALSCVVPPTDMFAEAGLTTTEATEALLTARIAWPVMPTALARTT